MAGLLEANRPGEVDLAALPAPVSQSVRSLLGSCLEPDPDRRTVSATAVRQALAEQLLRLRAAALLGMHDETAGSERGPAGGNLPRPRSSFIGRVEPLRRLEKALAEGRLVTVTGPGGVGKTRVAREAARRIGPSFPVPPSVLRCSVGLRSGYGRGI